MIFPPSILYLRKARLPRRGRGLWIPLVLIWGPLVVLWALLLPLILLAAVALWRSGKGKAILLGPPKLFVLFCRLRGFELAIEGKDTNVVIRIW